MKLKLYIVPALLLFFTHPNLYAQESGTPALENIFKDLNTNDQPDDFFTIDENRDLEDTPVNNTQFFSAQSLFKTVSSLANEAAVVLTKWVHHSSAPKLPDEKYNRKLHFGTWVNDSTDNNCFNVRAKVLIRDSKIPVTYKASNKCVIESGEWADPYTGKTFTQSSDIQIDHVVPLKHAYQTGAWNWDYKTRCSYANFMGSSFHLASVSGHENMVKGDGSPDEYMPPNTDIACSYLQRWLQIKLNWHLVIFPHEATAIENLMTQYNCNKNINMSRDELARQRASISDLFPVCSK